MPGLHPFDRTVCACEDCKRFCRHMPRMCFPGDVHRIARFQGVTVEFALSKLFVATPGALIVERGRIRRFPVITPAHLDDDPQKPCIFYQRGACAIHSVAPFGCAYCDHHMDATEGNARSSYCMGGIDADDTYKSHLIMLSQAGRVSLPAELKRAAMKQEQSCAS